MCNAMPPVFIRIAVPQQRTRCASGIYVQASNCVKSLSFDALAFQPRWGPAGKGVSGKVQTRQTNAVQYSLAAGVRTLMIEPGVGPPFMLYSNAVGADPTSTLSAPPTSPWEAGGPGGLSPTEAFALHPGEFSRLAGHLSFRRGAGSTFISVRYAGKSTRVGCL
jgi:hypothetical protein